MDISAFRQMVAKNPNGFLGRYGLGNKILQEGGDTAEAVEHLNVAVNLIRRMSRLTWRWAAPSRH